MYAVWTPKLSVLVTKFHGTSLEYPSKEPIFFPPPVPSDSPSVEVPCLTSPISSDLPLEEPLSNPLSIKCDPTSGDSSSYIDTFPHEIPSDDPISDSPYNTSESPSAETSSSSLPYSRLPYLSTSKVPPDKTCPDTEMYQSFFCLQLWVCCPELHHQIWLVWFQPQFLLKYPVYHPLQSLNSHGCHHKHPQITHLIKMALILCHSQVCFYTQI